MRFVTFAEVQERLRGKRIALVGSAPSCLDNVQGFVDAHEVVVRVNNFKLGEPQGYRVDVHYSFYGTSIRTSAAQLQRAGTWLCMCKCPDAKALESPWHERTGRIHGIDYRYIYRNRRDWWPCDVYVPTVEEYRRKFELLDKHIPTTGFAAVLDLVACEPSELYITGFDFFRSGLHNVNEAWQRGPEDDPIKHRPDLEAAWLFAHAEQHGIVLDRTLQAMRTEAQQCYARTDAEQRAAA